jgi:DNA-directed RNA polymerase specialized sigma24 family protein
MDIDNKIENALQDQNITKVMNKASFRFTNQLDSDSIYTCQLNALWKALVKFDPSRNVKFTTYLYNGVFIECLKEAKFHAKHTKFNCKKLHSNIMSNEDNHVLFDILDELEDEEEKSLIIDKYSNLTISEMAEKRNSNRETTRKKLKNICAKIEKRVKEVY